MWPGLVGKGAGGRACIDIDTLLDLTAKRGGRPQDSTAWTCFFRPHVSIDIDDDGIKRLAEKIQFKAFVIGSVVAPVCRRRAEAPHGQREERTRSSSSPPKGPVQYFAKR